MQDNRPVPAEYDVSIVGLGAMGATIAATFVENGQRAAVWNREAGKTERLVDLGAHRVTSVRDAVVASPVTVLVLLNAQVAAQLLDEAGDAVAGRVVVNFSTGTLDDHDAIRRSVEARGGHYFKGSILAYPRNVGRPDTYFVYSGDPAIFERTRPLLDALGGRSVHLSWEDSTAFGTAFIVQAYAAIAGFYEALAIGERLGMASATLAPLLSEAPNFFIADAIRDGAARIAKESFDGGQASIDVHAASFGLLARTIDSHGARQPVFAGVRTALEFAQQAGYGKDDIAAVFKVYVAAKTDAP